MLFQSYLKKRNLDETVIETEVIRYKEERKMKAGEEDAEVEEAMKRSRAKQPKNEPDEVR
jgi:hypothetical protein